MFEFEWRVRQHYQRSLRGQLSVRALLLIGVIAVATPRQAGKIKYSTVYFFSLHALFPGCGNHIQQQRHTMYSKTVYSQSLHTDLETGATECETSNMYKCIHVLHKLHNHLAICTKE